MDTATTTLREEADYAYIRAHRITRMNDHRLGRVLLNKTALQDLGDSGVGILIENCGTLERTIQHLKDLDRASTGVSWLVVVASKAANDVVYRQWSDGFFPAKDQAKVPELWRSGSMLFATPEALAKISGNETPSVVSETSGPVMGILVLDMCCHIHRARGNRDRRIRWIDRPSAITESQTRLSAEGWKPPIILITNRPAKSVETSSIVSTYGWDALWYLDGQTLTCRPLLESQNARTKCADIPHLEGRESACL